jgi:LPS export ABC transporter protein LptC
LAVGVVYGLKNYMDNLFEDDKTQKQDATAPDYFFSDFTMRIFNKEGLLEKTITGTKMQHFTYKPAIIENPQAKIHQDETNWYVSSDIAFLDSDNKNITFLHNSQIKNDHNSFLLTSDSVEISKSVISVPKRLFVEHKNSKIDAHSLKIDVDKNIISFSKVKGVYIE